jgi:GLPGLI family protein
MMKQFVLISLMLLCVGDAYTQSSTMPPIVFRGKLTFERKVNVHKQLDEMMKSSGNMTMAETMKKQVPKYKTDMFDLFFNETQSVYKPAPDGISESKMMMGNMPADRNIVHSDFEKKQVVAEKKVYEKVYLVADSVKNYEWKITEEFRKIAGFNCRRAETIMMDSVYVIAFYTDAILANGGPEGFNGLPGMILGIVMPRLNLTYFATGIDMATPTEKDMTAPSKGEKVTYKTLESKIRESMKQWGDYLQRVLWYIQV